MATLWTDTISPAELTGFARAAQEDFEARQGTLARFLPNTAVDDVVVRTVVGQDGSGEVAEYRAFDAESSIGSGGKGERKVFELLPVSRKERIGEFDQLRARGGDAAAMLIGGAEKAAVRTVRAISNRLEIARGQALETGGLTIDEGGVVQTPSFGRPSEHDVAPSGALWDASGAEIFEDLATWCEVYEDANDGAQAGTIVVSRRTLGVMLRDAGIRSLIGVDAGIASVGALNEVLAVHGLPNVEVFERKVGGQRVVSDHKVLILPEPVDPTGGQSLLGATFFGTTLEASEPEYGIAAGEQPGIAVGGWKTKDPIGRWVHANAIAMPVLVNPVASMVATVLDAS